MEMSSRSLIEMLKPARLAAAVFALMALALLSSCQWFVQDEIDRNAANLSKLRVGMTKEEARQIMGEPLVKEAYNSPNLWFYYVRPRWQDGAATKDECAPLVFDEDGLLAGWGQDYYKAHCEFTTWPAIYNKPDKKP